MDYTADIRRFSFVYDGKDIFSHSIRKDVVHNGEETVCEYRTEDGLKITNVCKKIRDFDAYHWVTWYENTGSALSKLFSNILDADISVPFAHDDPLGWVAYLPDPEKDMKIYAPTGSTWEKGEFYCNIDDFVANRYVNHIYPDDVKTFRTDGGRSSQARAPFFNITKQNKGIIFAIGWTGQWNCTMVRRCDSLEIRAGIEDAQFCLLPGEKIRTASILVMEYECEAAEAQNKWRRLIKKHFSLIGKDGRETAGPLCCGIWGGMNSSEVIQRIRLAKESRLPYEYLWMDAGWYGQFTQESLDEFQGDWPSYTGDWSVNATHHPDGLKEVVKEAQLAGMKFLLWFEPERVINGTPISMEHPEYFIKLSDGNKNLLLNLGNEDAWNYCFDMLCKKIEDLNIQYYRQDFNMDPLEYWRLNDGENRHGITQIKHIMGLYRLWDALLERFPNLMIDNCASGGRRLDIETLGRSVPLWRSDYQCPANYEIEAAQSHNMHFASWMPYSGTGTGRAMGDTYRMRSAYAGAMTTHFMFAGNEPLPNGEQIAWIKQYTNEYLKIREYFYADFYPLTDGIESAYSWNAAQYNRPENGDGILQAFRHEKSPFYAAIFQLKNLEDAATYKITDLDDDTFILATGKDLREKGFEVVIGTPRTAKLYIYQKN